MLLKDQRSVLLRALGISLLFTICAAAARILWNYPRCQNDELNWVHIAHSLDLGQRWPVSGPSFMYVLRSLKEETSWHYIHLISGVGVLGVLIGTLLLTLGYSKLRISKPGLTLTALALSSYFWVPLLEARPQQWGQIMVFIGAIAAWLWLHRRDGGWIFFVVLLTISVTHILSHAILVWVCSVLALADYFEKRPLNRRHATLVLCILLSLIVYIIPGGPYQDMLHDIQTNHMRRLFVALPYTGAAALLLVLAVVKLQPTLHWRPHWSQWVIYKVLKHKRLLTIALLTLFSIALTAQAWILPPQAWQLYDGSLWRFLLFQSGNLVFAWCFITGLFHFIQNVQSGEIDGFHARGLIWSLTGLALYGLVLLVASFWLIDTNWLLRLMNYAILFTAPIAALGLLGFLQRRKSPICILVLLPFFWISICQAVRPEGWLAC